MLKATLRAASVQTRYTSTKLSNDIVNPIITNRNPRNLERLRYAYKPSGYHLEKPGRNYWHNLEIGSTGRHVTASIVHYENGVVLSASTKEWAVQKQLYRTTDTSAYINIGRVLAQRCLEAGITEMSCSLEPGSPDGKVALLLQNLREGGVALEEPEQYRKPRPWDINVTKLDSKK